MSDSKGTPILTPASSMGTPATDLDDETWILPIIELCRNADLTLLVGEAPVHRFKVSRNTLCMASPVFCAMLVGRFAEARKDEFQLLGDDPDAMLIVLRIAHLRFNEVKRYFQKSSDLVRLATICDKYDMVAICRPFFPGWTENWLDKIDEDDDYWYVDDRLWLAWVFGYEKLFPRLTVILAETMTIDANGKREAAERSILNDQPMPLGIVGKLCSVTLGVLVQVANY